jgi:two-component system chemotaxis response regulator CheY
VIKPDLPYTPKTMRVMIIDDHDPMRKALRRILSGMGFGTIIECIDGGEALKTLSKSSVDLIISDIFMRKVDGFTILKKVRTQDIGADIPVIIVTGEATKEDIVKAADLGADDYVLKPFQISDIEKKVSAVLLKYYSPTPLLKLLREGDKLALQGNHLDALKLYEAATRLDPKSPRAKFSKALMLSTLGEPVEAVKILEESSKEHPAYNKNFAALADIHMYRNDPRSAIDAMRHELELNPRQIERQNLVANLLMNDGQYEEAIKHFKAALLENPKDKEAILGSGRAFQKLGNSEKALYYYRRARRQYPSLTKALRLMISVYEQDKNQKGAIFEILDEINKNPARFDARVVLSEIHASNDDMEGALKVIDEGLARDPKNLVLLKGKSKLLVEDGRVDEACELMKQVVDMDGSEANILAYAETVLSAARPLDAYMVLHRALASPKDRQKVLAKLAESMKRLGYFAQAITTLELALQAGGNMPPKVLREDIRSMMPGVNNRRTGHGLKKSS